MDAPPTSQLAPVNAEQVCTVASLVHQVREALDKAIPLQWVSGEISGFKRATSGHSYFELKDANAQVACVLYRNRAALVGFELRDGVQVELRVRPSLYEPRGALQFAVEQTRLAGVGRRYEAFLRLKAQLENEGLFAHSRKRVPPSLPRCIGLITSPNAAALADILRVLRDRWPQARVVLYPTSVQGQAAPSELRAALRTANTRAECEVLIIGRGGGSIEDLWAFNDEALARAIAASAIPIVSAVGHETDFTLCDFAADVRAPTPTAAAAMVVPERVAMRLRCAQIGERLNSASRHRIDSLSQRLDRVCERLRTSDHALAPRREQLLRLSARLGASGIAASSPRRSRLAALQTRFARALSSTSGYAPAASRHRLLHSQLLSTMRASIDSRGAALFRASQALKLLNPESVLERGYAIVLDAEQRVVTQAESLAIGDKLTVRLRRGSLGVGVERKVS